MANAFCRAVRVAASYRVGQYDVPVGYVDRAGLTHCAESDRVQRLCAFDWLDTRRHDARRHATQSLFCFATAEQAGDNTRVTPGVHHHHDPQRVPSGA
jgi:hypothetical protein